MSKFLEVNAVTKIYRTARGVVTALENVSFAVDKGEFLAIVGPSGCGKSTLLRIVAGLRNATEGMVLLERKRVTAPLRTGMVFQAPSLLPWRSTLDNVLLSVDLAGLPTSRYRERAMELLDLVGLAGFARQLPSELSGGMQQRVALCRALIHDPDLLLMDEPFGALDAMTRDEMNFELLRIWSTTEEKKTILFVTHSIGEAVFLADRILVMSARPGRVDEISSSILGRPRTLEMRGSADFGAQVIGIYQRLHAGRGSTHAD
jgi:NitT/TauT family transport system ATP-binding protein